MESATIPERKIVVCIPVLNDWDSILELIPRIDRAFSETEYRAELMIVDDGSDEAHPKKINCSLKSVGQIIVLRLRRNLGHQRAIAIGLSYIQSKHPHEAVVIMDGDGEDPPEGLTSLLSKYRECKGKRLIMARRGKRSEGLRFRFFYKLYRMAHWLITGYRAQAGNFCVVPSELVDRLVGVSAIWNHFASSVVIARIPYDSATVDRSPRIAGRPKMSFQSLIKHGLSAMSVFSDAIGLRLLALTFSLALLALIGVAIVVFVRLATDLAIPGWASISTGILTVLFLQAFLMSMAFMFITLQDRKGTEFLPIRDYHPFIYKVDSIRFYE